MDMAMNYQSNDMNNNVADTTSTTDIMNLRTHLQYSDQNVLDRQYCDDFVLDVFADEQDQIQIILLLIISVLLPVNF